MTFPNFLRCARFSAGLSQAQLAERVRDVSTWKAITPEYISRIENGHTDVSASNIINLLRALNVTAAVTGNGWELSQAQRIP